MESVAVTDVIVDKLYFVKKSSRSLSLTGVAGDDGVLAASLEYPIRQKNGKKSTAITKLACDLHKKGKYEWQHLTGEVRFADIFRW